MTDEAKGGAELTSQEKADQEYQAEWKRLEALESGEPGKDVKPEDEGTTEKEAAPQEGKDDPAPQDEKKQEETSKTYGTVASMEKALNDTKSYARKLEGELAELRKLKESGATKKEVEDQKKVVSAAKDNLDDIKAKVYDDYPELKELLDPMIERNRTLETELESIKQATKADAEKASRQAALDAFNDNVKPRIVAEHPDFDAIVKADSYWKWVEEQRPALKFAASESNDPADINWALSEFKKSKYAGDIEKLKQEESEKRKRKITDAQTLRGGSAGPPSRSTGKKDPNDYDGGFNEAAALLEKEGIRA